MSISRAIACDACSHYTTVAVPHHHAGCYACSAGRYSTAGSVKCTTCAVGQYAGAAAPKCTQCAAGKSVDAGKGTQAGDCEDCIDGHYAASGAACTVCAAGKSASIGTGACDSCAAGRYAEGISPSDLKILSCSASDNQGKHPCNEAFDGVKTGTSANKARCTDTPDWKNGARYNCADYVTQGWCADGNDYSRRRYRMGNADCCYYGRHQKPQGFPTPY